MDNVRFCYNARDSLDETLNHLIGARDLGYCSTKFYEELRIQVEEVRRLLNGYIGWLKEREIGANEPGARLAVQGAPAAYVVDMDEFDGS